MLPKQYRLTQKKDFQLVLKKGRISHGKYFNLFTLQNQESLQIGIIVSNKVSKKATERNRIRRIIRNICRESLKDLKSGCWYLFLVKSQAREIEAEKITLETKRILEK